MWDVGQGREGVTGILSTVGRKSSRSVSWQTWSEQNFKRKYQECSEILPPQVVQKFKRGQAHDGHFRHASTLPERVRPSPRAWITPCNGKEDWFDGLKRRSSAEIEILLLDPIEAVEVVTRSIAFKFAMQKLKIHLSAAQLSLAHK